MIAEPLPFVVGGVTHSLARIGQTGDGKKFSSSIFSTADGLVNITISQNLQNNGRLKVTCKFEQSKIVDVDDNVTDTITETVSFERPFNTTFSATEMDNLNTGIESLLTTAFITKLYGRET